MKSEEKQSIKAIQLTGRDNSAVWKTKDNGDVLMSDMNDSHIQAALVTVQQRQLRNFDTLRIDFRLEEQLKKEAANRGLILKDFEENSSNWYAERYRKNKELLKQVANYLKRKVNEKIKAISKETV